MWLISRHQAIRTWNEGSRKSSREKLRQVVEIEKMQFGFRSGTGTTHAIFIVASCNYKRDIEKNTGNCGGHL